MTYDDRGRKLTETNQLGLTRTFTYDLQGLLASVSLPDLDGDPLTTSDIPTYTYAYNEFGNQTLLVDPLGRETSWLFDDQGRETSRILPDGSTESYTYDDRGRRLTHTSFEGVVTTFVYNTQAGRLDQRLFDNSTTTEDWSFTYDAFGREVLAVQSGTGRTQTTTYDAQRRVESVSSPEGVVSYEYDDFGRTVRMTIGDLSTPSTDTRSTYDALGRLNTVEVVRRNNVDLTTPEVTTYEYNLIGSLSKMTAPNGIVTDYVYDDLNRLTSLTNTDAGGNTLSSYVYQLQADGRRTQSTEQLLVSGSLQTTTFNWTYDRLGRLVTEVYDAPGTSDDWTTTYTFDLTGNRLSKETDNLSDSTVDETITYVYDTNDRLLTEALDTDGLPGAEQTTTYGYTFTQQTSKTVTDSVSSVLSVVLYSYDLQGRMDTVTADTIDTDGSTILSRQTTTFDYDTRGIRVSEEHTVDAGNDGTLETHTQTTYLADHRNQTGYAQTVLQLETDVLTNETTRTDTTYGLDEITQTTTDASGNATTYVFLHDGHGSTRALTNMSGGIVETYTYDAYGNAEGFDPQVALTGLLANGEYFQATIGLSYNRARWYDPKTGTWKRLDDFFGNKNDPQSFNKYLYTHADPVNGVDPTGEFSLVGAVMTAGIGSFLLAEAASFVYAGANAGWGLYNGSIGVGDAAGNFISNLAKAQVVIGIGVGLALAPFVLSTGASFALLGAIVTIGSVNVLQAGGPEEAVQAQVFKIVDPMEALERNKIAINWYSALYDVPAEIVASVLLAELWDYSIYDYFGDDFLFGNSEARSMGIAQLRVDNIRNWGLTLDWWDADPAVASEADIRWSILHESESIPLLAQAVKYFTQKGYANGTPGPNLANWDQMPDWQKSSRIADYGRAKDNIDGFLGGVANEQLGEAAAGAFIYLTERGWFD